MVRRESGDGRTVSRQGERSEWSKSPLSRQLETARQYPSDGAQSVAANPAAYIEPEFSQFVAAMRDKLIANADKRDSWRRCAVVYLRDGLDQELAEADTDGGADEWVDVANYAFFLAARKEEA